MTLLWHCQPRILTWSVTSSDSPEVEYLEDLRVGEAEHDDTSKLGQGNTAQYLRRQGDKSAGTHSLIHHGPGQNLPAGCSTIPVSEIPTPSYFTRDNFCLEAAEKTHLPKFTILHRTHTPSQLTYRIDQDKKLTKMLPNKYKVYRICSLHQEDRRWCTPKYTNTNTAPKSLRPARSPGRRGRLSRPAG